MSEDIAQARDWPTSKPKAQAPTYDKARTETTNATTVATVDTALTMQSPVDRTRKALSPVVGLVENAPKMQYVEKAPQLQSSSLKNQDLNPCADKFLPIAQKESSRAKVRALTLDNKIPSAETCLSRIKASPVVEDKAQNPKSQAPMWTGPSWRTIVAQRRGSSSDKRWIRCAANSRSPADAATATTITGKAAPSTNEATAAVATMKTASEPRPGTGAAAEVHAEWTLVSSRRKKKSTARAAAASIAAAPNNNNNIGTMAKSAAAFELTATSNAVTNADADALALLETDSGWTLVTPRRDKRTGTPAPSGALVVIAEQGAAIEVTANLDAAIECGLSRKRRSCGY